ncbi:MULTISPECIES: hypothetical protein [Paraclostridium]|uniref:Uncharacterized protein n=1 Tax=Paraclostridium benzoelyticum TaxID=1629550 RepID=A0A0M3DHN1_9FIRM|nr:MULTISPECIES: hypothetical protein [Paraclostridium]KKY01651.1 hypothetical protein VN21_07700 [Paraclostridium benzoelyticum]MCU9815678.1 hypothetical protein [Paraclostridium sp. AKS73]OXX83742.1 hypothetical protein AVM15_08805 [Paraclostridium benzoelyticum]OXX84240.1 hypothetical protein AVM15_05520 [Paraclostridium benzoelyticum]
MKNLINWMCLLSVMGLVLQVMIHINSEIIREFNSAKSKKTNMKAKRKSIANTRVKRTGEYYQEKIAK